LGQKEGEKSYITFFFTSFRNTYGWESTDHNLCSDYYMSTFKKAVLFVLHMSYLKSALRGTAWVMFFHIAASIVSYVNRIVLARNMTPSEYGVFYSVFTFVTFFLFFRELGLLQALSKYIPEYKLQERYDLVKSAIVTTTLMQFAGSVLFSIAFYASAGYLSQHYFRAPEADFYLKFLIIYFLASVIFRTMKSVLQGFQSMFWFASSEFVKNVVTLLLTLLFFSLGFGIRTPLYAFVFVFPLMIVLYAIPTLRSYNIFAYNTSEFRRISAQLFLFSTPVFLSSVATKIIGYVDTLILTYYRSSAEVGIYNVILPTALIFLFIGQGVSATIFPLSSELWAKNDKKRLADGLQLIYKYIFLLSIPIIGTVLVYSYEFIATFFGVEYAGGAFALQILLFGVLFYTVSLINENIVSGIGKPHIIMKIIVAAAIVNIVINFMFIPSFGINGAAVATTVSYVMMFIFTTARAARFVEMKLPFYEWGKLLVPTAAFFAVHLVVRYASLSFLHNFWANALVVTVIAGLAYTSVAFALGLFSFSDVRKLILRLV